MTRVLLAPENPAGVASALRDGLRRRGHRADVVTFRRHPFGFAHDRLAATPRDRVREAARALRHYDVLHWQFGTTLLEFLDAAAARGRLQLMHYWGDDARTELIATRLGGPRAALLGTSAGRDERTTLRRLRLAARLCRAALVSDLELASYVRPWFDRVYLVPTPLSPVTAAPATGNGPAVVLHAPSDAAIKGTAEIAAVLDRLAARGLLRPRLVTGVPHTEVMREIAAADVVVDQLNSETSGVLALEAMALGKPVLAQFRRELLAPFARDTPLVAVTAETLERELEALLGEPGRVAALGRAGPEFVAAVHATDRVAAALEGVYAHAAGAPRGTYEATAEGVEPLRLPSGAA